MATVAEAFVTLRPELGKFGAETEQQLKGATSGLDNFGKQAGSSFDEATKKSGGFSDSLKNVGTMAAGFLAAGAIQKGIGAVTGFMNDSIGAAKESIEVNAQLESVLKSTGGAAGVTAQQARELASAIELNSKFEDEAVLKGENLLLTFTNIGSDTFPRATQSMVDMAQAMGTDATGAAIQLGKALNDPTQGISALSRVGVSFTDEQKEQIKTMQESGDVAGAQAIILGELEKEFGGSAKAASDAAGSSEKYKDKMNELKEEIGSRLLPIQLKWQEIQAAVIGFIIDRAIPAIQNLAEQVIPTLTSAFESVKEAVQPALDAIIPFVEKLSENQDVLTVVAAVIGVVLVGAFLALAVAAGAAAVSVLIAMAPFILITAVIVAVIAGIALLVTHWDELTAKFPILATVAEAVGAALTAAWAAIQTAVGAAVTFITENIHLLEPVFQFMVDFVTAKIDGIIQIFQGLVQIISGVIALVSAIFHGEWAAAWEALKQIATGILDVLLGEIGALFGNIPGIILDVAGQALSAGATLAQNIFNGVIDTLSSLPGEVGGIISGIPGEIAAQAGAAISAATNFANNIINAIKSALRNFTISGSIGGIDLGPLGSTPSVSVSLQPFGFLKEGIGAIPWDNFAAMLHKGEAVIPADMNPFNPDNSGKLGSPLGGGGVSLNFNAPVTIAASNRAEAEQSAGFFAWGLVSAIRVRG